MPDSSGGGAGNSGNQGSGNQGANGAAWLSAGASVLGGIGSLLGVGGEQGLSRDDQRWLADFQWKQALRNEEFQNKLATHGIRMKVEDAAAAGLHPLAALGATTGGGSFGTAFSGGGSPGESTGSKLRNLSQDISRATTAMATPEEKAFKQLQLQKMHTENEILNTELAERRNKLRAPGTGAGIPGDNAGYTIAGQSDVMRTKTMPSVLTASERGADSQSAGANPLFDMYKTKRGFMGLLNQKASEATEDDYLAKLAIHLQNLTSGAAGPQTMTSRFKTPPGHRQAYGGPVMGYAPIPNNKQTVWEAVHHGANALRGFANEAWNYGRYFNNYRRKK